MRSKTEGPRSRNTGRIILYALLIVALPSLGALQYRLVSQLSEREYDHARSVLQLSGMQIVNSYAQSIYVLRQSVERPMPVPTSESHRMFTRQELPILLGAAERYIDTIYQSRLGTVLDSTPIRLSIFDEQGHFQSTTYSLEDREFDDITTSTQKPPFPGWIGPVVDTQSPQQLLLRGLLTRPTGAPWVYYLTAHIKPSFFNHLMDSLKDRALPSRSEAGKEYVIAIGHVGNQRPRQLVYTQEPSLDWNTPDLEQPIFFPRTDLRVVRQTTGHTQASRRGAARNRSPRSSAVAEHVSEFPSVFGNDNGSSYWGEPQSTREANRAQFGGQSGSRRSDAQSHRRSIDSSLYAMRPGEFAPGMIFPSRNWVLLIKSRSGSILTTIGGFKRRNLFISFGIILALGCAMILLIISNNRAQKLAEQQVRFIAGISHELRTPIAVIRSASENISDGIITDPKRLSVYGKLILRETDNLWSMVERVLQYATLTASASTPTREFDANDIVREAVLHCEALAKEAHVRLDMDLSQQPLPMTGDPTSLQTAIENLITNAIKYGSPEPDPAAPAAFSDFETRVEVITLLHRTHDGSQRIIIIVRDHGEGIAEEEQQLIFDPFYRGSNSTQTRGNGLGLSLVKNAIEQHGGSVSLESAPGEGSTFRIDLRGPA